MRLFIFFLAYMLVFSFVVNYLRPKLFQLAENELGRLVSFLSSNFNETVLFVEAGFYVGPKGKTFLVYPIISSNSWPKSLFPQSVLDVSCPVNFSGDLTPDILRNQALQYLVVLTRNLLNYSKSYPSLKCQYGTDISLLVDDTVGFFKCHDDKVESAFKTLQWNAALILFANSLSRWVTAVFLIFLPVIIWQIF